MRLVPVDLERACRQALYTGARAAGAGTRQEIRAAVRRFLRRHRHDHDYLRRVVRAVLVSSALAVSILGLGAPPAAGRATDFYPLTGVANALGGFDVGQYSTPALGDLDGDGDLDLVVGEFDGSFRYFANIGTATNPAFEERTDTANPAAGFDVGYYSTPTLGDLDADGDLDLVAGGGDGAFRFYWNTGTATSPIFVALTGPSNPFNGVDVGSDSAPALGDLDGDGDLDLIAGDSSGHLAYAENIGGAGLPEFVERTGTDNPLDGQDVGSYSAPALGITDGDGDLDLVVGEASGAFFYFENTGTRTAARFAARTNSANPLAGQESTYASTPALGDLDADGDLDLVAGRYDGGFTHLRNLLGRFVGRGRGVNPVAGEDVGFRSAPVAGDLDADGDLDLVAGESYGAFLYFENIGNAQAPEFLERSGTGSPLAGLDAGSYATPALGDLDGDDDLDLVAGGFFGFLEYFENTGSAQAPSFVLRTGTASPVWVFDLGNYSTATLGDLDGDGDLDLVAGESYGALRYFENTGSREDPSFAARTGTANPLDGHDVGSFAAPVLGDADGDHDLDVVSGRGAGVGSFSYFENTGGAGAPAYALRTGSADPTSFLSMPVNSTPALGDLDGDGDLDILAGSGEGTFWYFENALPRASPRYHPLPPPVDPLAGSDIGAYSVATQGDLDADGDLDLVAADVGGGLHYFENTGTATSPAFAERVGIDNPLDGESGGQVATPVLSDLDADGDLDLVCGNNSGSFVYWANLGTAPVPDFVAQTSALNLLDVGIYSAAALGDLDADGDPDLVAGELYGTLHYFENTGTAINPMFLSQTGTSNPFEGLVGGAFPRPALGDVDGDGDLDLVSGEYFGGYFYLENTGSAANPLFALRTGSANPLDGEDAGDVSSAALGDLTGDGGLDLVSGRPEGTFTTYTIPEPRQGLLIGAGLAALTLLHHLRRKLGEKTETS